MNKINGIHHHFPVLDRYPRPDWEKISEWIENNHAPEDRHTIHDEIIINWFEEMLSVLPARYNIYESPDLILLTYYEQSDVILQINFINKVKSYIQSLGLSNKDREGYGSIVILQFDDPGLYLEYVYNFFPDGNFINSAGLCIREYLTHVVTSSGDYNDVEYTIAHELLHEQVTDLNLPLWIDEGLAEMVTEHIFPHYFDFNLDQAKEELIFFSFPVDNIQKFWGGKGFFESNESSAASYLLAHLMMKKICEQFDNALEFILNAKIEDSGQSSALNYLETPLEELVSSFLGDGNWKPGQFDPTNLLPMRR